MDIFWLPYLKYILYKNVRFLPSKMGATADPLKKVQSQFFNAENTFCEHYGHKPDFWVFAFRVFKTPTRKGQNGHF
jgi:hypothetical protein